MRFTTDNSVNKAGYSIAYTENGEYFLNIHFYSLRLIKIQPLRTLLQNIFRTGLFF